MNKTELRSLFNDLSLEEKIGQLLQLDAGSFLTTNFATGPAAQRGFTEQDTVLCGSVLNLHGAQRTADIQREYMAKHPHHIPLILMLDIIHGYTTSFPTPLAQSCSFNPAIAEMFASAAAKEGSAAGVHVTFSPMADLVTDARWGRVVESSGEDPVLSSAFAAACVRGYQNGDLRHPGSLASCAKHFAAYGSPIAGSEYTTVEIGYRTLLNDYLIGYKACIEEGCKMMMTSFNTIDSVPSTGNKHLMRDILRDKLGFNGMLVSDWGAIAELVAHGIAKDERAAAKLAINAGVDMDMVSTCYVRELKKLVDSGEIDISLIDEAAWRILSLKNDLGLFEDPYRGSSHDDFITAVKESKELGKKLSSESFVLLKNDDNILPITSGKTAFIGPHVNDKDIHGCWSLFADVNAAVTIKDGVEALGKVATFCKGSPLLSPGTVIHGFSAEYIEPEYTEDELSIMAAEACENARNADTVVLCLGEQRFQSGEGGSRTSPDIPAPQVELIKKVYEVNQNIVAVIFAGRPLVLTDILPYCKSILYVWFPGTMGGAAIADALYGNTEPSGHITMTFPVNVGQCPITYRGLRTGRPRTPDSPPTRFLKGYLDSPVEPLFPFGYGLSYSSWYSSKPVLSSDVLTASTPVTVSCTVTNTGDRISSNVLQLYINDCYASVCRPVKELKDWKRITLGPGESENITFEIREDMLRFYDINMNYTSEPGEFIAYIGFDSVCDNSCSFTLE